MKLDSAKLTEVVDAKIKEGKTMEEALKEIDQIDLSTLARDPKPKIVDRIAYIKGLDNIQEVRKASKAAYAKRAKAKDEEADERYGQEVFAAQERLAELNELIAKADKPLAKALELGEDQEGVVQRSLDLFPDLETRFKKHLKRIGMTQKRAKLKFQNVPTEVPAEIVKLFTELDSSEPNPYVEIYKSRVMRNDQRVLALTRTLNFLAGKAS